VCFRTGKSTETQNNDEEDDNDDNDDDDNDDDDKNNNKSYTCMCKNTQGGPSVLAAETASVRDKTDAREAGDGLNEKQQAGPHRTPRKLTHALPSAAQLAHRIPKNPTKAHLPTQKTMATELI